MVNDMVYKLYFNKVQNSKPSNTFSLFPPDVDSWDPVQSGMTIDRRTSLGWLLLGLAEERKL